MSGSTERERGGASVEFALCFTFLFIPLFFGTLTMGMNLVRTIQLNEFCRNAAHMYYNGVDFSQSSAQTLLLKMGPELGITATGGNGVVYLTTLTNLSSATCGGCANAGKIVITNRLVIGNTSIHSSSGFGTPPCTLASNGDVPTSSCEYTNTSDRSTKFSNVLALSADETAYMAEVWISNSDISFWTYLGTTTASARSIFGQ